MKNLVLLICMMAFSIHWSHAQKNVGINTPNPDPSAALDITSSDKGVLIPRMSKGQRDQIPSPATGLMIYQNDGDAGFFYYNGNAWVSISGSSGSGSSLPPIAGNAGKVLTNDGSQAVWGDQIAALSLYDANGNKLGRVITTGLNNFVIATSTGYYATIGVGGSFTPNQLYWSGNCSGEVYLNSGGGPTLTAYVRNGKYLSYAASNGKLYKFTNITNGVVISANISPFPASIENSGVCAPSGGTMAKDGWNLTEIPFADAGINAPYPFALPLEVR